MGFSLNSLVSAGTLGLVPDITGEDAAAAAAAAANQGSQAGIAETRRQFDLTRADLLPFLEAATGEGGALGQFQAGIDQAPAFDEVSQFQFDPTTAMDSPAMQFQLQQGQQQLDRLSGANRQLGSGQRLIGAQQFGQGLASQSLGDEFNRQFQTQQQQNNALLQNNALRNEQFNQRMNRLAGLVDVGRGTGTALGQLGGQSSANISGLMQNIGQTNAANALAQSSGINNLVGQGIGAAGMMLGGGLGGLGGAAAGGA